MNTTEVVKGNLLAKVTTVNLFERTVININFSPTQTLTIGLRLCSSKDSTVMHTANAMVSQMVTAVFERVLIENETKPRGLI